MTYKTLTLAALMMGMAASAVAQTGVWHRYTEWDIGNSSWVCPPGAQAR